MQRDLRAGIDAVVLAALSASNETANAILAPCFNEIEPSLILRCAREVNASLEMVNRLYAQTLSLGFMPSPEWETAVAHLQVGANERPALGS